MTKKFVLPDITQRSGTYIFPSNTLPAALFAHTYTYSPYDGNIYIVGGYTTAVQNAAYQFNPRTGIFTSMTSYPINVAYTGLAAWDKYIYLVGGYNGSTIESSVRRYDLSQGLAGSWVSCTNLPTTVDWTLPVVIGDYLYYPGGSDGNNTGRTSNYRYHLTDGTSGSWDTMATMPNPRWAVGTVVSDGTDFYVLGGLSVSTYYASFYRYNVASNDWTTLTSHPYAVGWHAHAAYAQGVIYVFGGLNNSITEMKTCTKYIIATDTWEYNQILPFDWYMRGGTQSAYVPYDGCIYLLGGYGKQGTAAAAGQNVIFKFKT